MMGQRPRRDRKVIDGAWPDRNGAQGGHEPTHWQPQYAPDRVRGMVPGMKRSEILLLAVIVLGTVAGFSLG